MSKLALDQLYDFAEFARRALELYDRVRSGMTQRMLLDELHNRLRRFKELEGVKPFEPHLLTLAKLLSELPAHPEEVDSAIEAVYDLSSSIDRLQFIRAQSQAA